VEIIAWGLIDEKKMNRILGVNPEDLNAEFRLLTGAEPLNSS
jgi:hypothetical protein